MTKNLPIGILYTTKHRSKGHIHLHQQKPTSSFYLFHSIFSLHTPSNVMMQHSAQNIISSSNFLWSYGFWLAEKECELRKGLCLSFLWAVFNIQITHLWDLFHDNSLFKDYNKKFYMNTTTTTPHVNSKRDTIIYFTF